MLNHKFPEQVLHNFIDAEFTDPADATHLGDKDMEELLGGMALGLKVRVKEVLRDEDRHRSRSPRRASSGTPTSAGSDSDRVMDSPSHSSHRQRQLLFQLLREP